MGRILHLATTCLLVIGSFGCSSRQRIPVVEQTRTAMGTFFTIALYGRVEPAAAEEAIAAAFDTIQAVEGWASAKLPGSEISVLNRAAGRDTVAISADLSTLLNLARQVSEMTHGAFDVTVGALTTLWGFEDSPQAPPDSAAVDSARRLVGYSRLWVGDGRAYLGKPGMRLDLGAIAKGWAVDRAFEVLRGRGFADVLVDGGGDLRVSSSPVTAGRRRVWVRHPRRAGEYFARFPYDSGAVATSGDYERYFLHNGVRFHHILDPQTGWPARGCVSVTVLGPDATLCDAWATAIFVLGPEKGLEIAKQIPDIETLIVFEVNGQLFWRATERLSAMLEILDPEAQPGPPAGFLRE
jgi:thiamine biosynthesis lipoprotein